MANSEDAMARSFANIAYSTFKHRLILQRYAIAGETQTNDWGLPVDTDTNLQSDSDAIPCTYTVQSGREMVIDNQPRTVTHYKITIPRLYKSGGVLVSVDFSTLYKVKLMPANRPPLILDIISGDPDPGPAIVFEAVKLEGQRQ